METLKGNFSFANGQAKVQFVEASIVKEQVEDVYRFIMNYM